MNFKSRNIAHSIRYIPIIGIIAFIALYIYASTLYPGGSQANLNTEEFDWIHNYWCNLMNEKGMNGKHNPARPWSISAMTILCLSVMVFFIQFANLFIEGANWRRIIKISGILSMSTALLIFTKHHDLMTMLSSAFGLFAVLGIMRAIFKSQWTNYKRGGIICILLLAINNFIYYTEYYITYLPLLQKITFTIVLLWIIALNIEMIRTKIV